MQFQATTTRQEAITRTTMQLTVNVSQHFDDSITVAAMIITLSHNNGSVLTVNMGSRLQREVPNGEVKRQLSFGQFRCLLNLSSAFRFKYIE
jgi:hypothetical protein